MLKLLIGLTLILLSTTYLQQDQVWSSEETQQQEFEQYETKYNKRYQSDAERRHRFNIFQSKIRRIKEHNARKPLDRWGINAFSDIDDHELEEKYFMHLKEEDDPTLLDDDSNILYHTIEQKQKLNSFNSYAQYQSSEWYVDWRQHDTPVQYQGSCGACWAFATADTLANRLSQKGQLDLKTVKQLSKTQLIDCAVYPYYRCYGCRGGWPRSALEYVYKTGLVPENEYRHYNEQEQECELLGDGEYGKENFDFEYKTYPDASYIEKHLKKGPVIVIMYSTVEWFSYDSGELDACSNSSKYMHAMEIVGFNFDQWLVKNSWGHWWGENGYFRISKQKCTQIYRVVVPSIRG